MRPALDLARWEWTCACCGRRKRGVPDLAYDAPVHADWAEAGDSDFRVLDRNADLCVMEIGGARHFFIRGVLCLPVAGTGATFGIGAWSSLSEVSYRRYVETSGDDRQAGTGGMFGYLANRLPFYPDTLNLRLDVLPQGGRRRPHLFVQSAHAGHPLHADQTQGLDAGRLTALLSAVLPCEGRG